MLWRVLLAGSRRKLRSAVPRLPSLPSVKGAVSIYTPYQLQRMQQAGRKRPKRPLDQPSPGRSRTRIVGLSRKGQVAAAGLYQTYGRKTDLKIRGLPVHDYSALVDDGDAFVVDRMQRRSPVAAAYTPRKGGLAMQALAGIAHSRADSGFEFAAHMDCQPRPDDGNRVRRVRSGVPSRPSRWVPWCKE